ncbi:MAG: SAM-dependent methyltransferase [Candidatus Hadarchaeota archaeon]
MLFVIEHLEPKLSEWLFIEYSSAARIVGRNNLMITNLKSPGELRRLGKISNTERKRVGDVFDLEELVVLDPRARKKLSPADLDGKKTVVVGGILGNDPPMGRTGELLTKHLQRATKRNLGRNQFSIDGAIYVAKLVGEGKQLEDVPVRLGLEIKITKNYSVSLPYAFPLVGRKPLISPELVGYLKKH